MAEEPPYPATDSAQITPAPTPHRARVYLLLQQSWKQTQVRAGLNITLAILLLALLGPWLAPHAPTAFAGPVYGAPSTGAPLGYDFLGRDVLSRVLAGGWSIVWMSVASAVIALLIGVTLGLLAGFLRGWIDGIITWSADILLAFPNLILVLLIVSMLGRNPVLIVFTVAVAFIPGVIRLARSVTLGVVGQEFVEAAQMLGYPRSRILLREVLPNIATPLLVHLGAMLSWAVALVAGLSFLGYGIAAPAADWGLMINENRAGLQVQPWALLVPALLTALFALGTNMLAEGLGRVNARIKDK